MAEGDHDDAGTVVAIHGLTIDLTRAMAVESGDAGAAALVNAYSSRGTLEQAKGILMGYFNIGAEEAFRRLADQSQHTNTKAAALAANLVAAAESGKPMTSCTNGRPSGDGNHEGKVPPTPGPSRAEARKRLR